MLSDLAEEVATGEELHDEELVGAMLYAAFEGNDARVIRDELVETNLAEEGVCVVGVAWASDGFYAVVSWMCSCGVGVKGEVGDPAAAFAQDANDAEAAIVNVRVEFQHAWASKCW